MDNERPIEKLLRDYAKKRRAEAGKPLEMHPVTRRMLQGEVARRFPRAKRGSSLVEFFGRWRPGLVYGICALAVIAISVPFLLPTFRKASPESQLAKARLEDEAADKKLQTEAPSLTAAPTRREADEKRSAEHSNESGQTTLAFADTVQAKDTSSGLSQEKEKQESRPVRTLKTDTLSPTAPATAPPPQIASRDRATFDAQSRLERSARETRADDAGKPAGETRRAVTEELAAGAGEKPDASRAAPPPKPADSPAGVALAARSTSTTPTSSATAPVRADSTQAAAFRARYGLPMNAAVAVVQRFAQTQAAGGYLRSADAAAASPVLGTFQLEQTGDQLRVIDSDGSTYTGAITSSATDAYHETKVELKSKSVKPGEKTASQTLSTAAEFNYQAGQNYFFRVTGTNRTLRQPVVFAGSILISTNAPTTGQTVLAESPAGRSQNQPAPAQNILPSLLNSAISGKVQLGTNKEMQINAQPVNP